MIQMQTDSIRRTMFEHNGDSLEVKIIKTPNDRGIMRDEVVISLRVNGVLTSKRITINERREREALELFFSRCTEQFND